MYKEKGNQKEKLRLQELPTSPTSWPLEHVENKTKTNKLKQENNLHYKPSPVPAVFGYT